jgi:hypothetical protein
MEISSHRAKRRRFGGRAKIEEAPLQYQVFPSPADTVLNLSISTHSVVIQKTAFMLFIACELKSGCSMQDSK